MQSVLRRGDVLLWIAVLLTSMSGCVVMSGKIEEGKQIDEAKVNQIVIGKSRRSDVYKLFGTPHSQFRGQVEFIEGRVGVFFSHVGNRYLSSLDDNHYAMLYRFTTSQVGIVMGSIVVVMFQNVKETIKSDELLLLLDKETNIVVDVAYRK